MKTKTIRVHLGIAYRKACENSLANKLSKTSIRRLKKYLPYTNKSLSDLIEEQRKCYQDNFNARMGYILKTNLKKIPKGIKS